MPKCPNCKKVIKKVIQVSRVTQAITVDTKDYGDIITSDPLEYECDECGERLGEGAYHS